MGRALLMAHDAKATRTRARGAPGVRTAAAEEEDGGGDLAAGSSVGEWAARANKMRVLQWTACGLDDEGGTPARAPGVAKAGQLSDGEADDVYRL